LERPPEDLPADRHTEARVKQQIEASYQQAAEQRRAAEADRQ